MAFKFLFLPPQRAATRAWASSVAEAVPEARVVVAETDGDARREIRDADAAFGTIPAGLLGLAGNLRWLQAPAAAPPAGYYHPERVRHPVVVTNFRDIYNDHIAAHVMAFVLAFARVLHRYVPQQLRREWNPAPPDSRVVHPPESTALVIGVGGIGSETARLCGAFGMRVVGVDARREDAPPGVAEMHPQRRSTGSCPRPTSSS